MFIITRFEISDAQRKRIAEVLGRPGLAEREQVRTFLQQQGEQTLEALTLPLMSPAATTRRTTAPAVEV